MEKIMNLQMPGSMSMSTQASRLVQGSDAGDGFLQMLQQKQEASAPDSKKEDQKVSGSDAKSDTREEPKKAASEDEEPTEEMQQLAQELAAQQAAVQQTIVTPDWQEQTVQTEIMVEAEEVLPVELPTESVKPAVTEQAEVPTAEKAEPSVKPAEDLTAQQVVPETRPEEGGQELSLSDRMAQSRTEESAPKEAVRETASKPVQEERSVDSEEEPKAVYSQNVQSPVLSRTDTVVKGDSTEAAGMKATVEEFPEELGKALASGRVTDGQTFTVELEPVSLGKLTIRVEYEAGRAAVSILASNPKTLEILSEKASEIASILKEHTGEETVIYTQEAPKEQDQHDGHPGSGQGGREERREQKQEDRHEAESFAQQLRLGLI